MMDILKIDNQDLHVLLELDDLEYSKITICLDRRGNKIFVINGNIVEDSSIIEHINKKYQLNKPEEYKGIIF